MNCIRKTATRPQAGEKKLGFFPFWPAEVSKKVLEAEAAARSEEHQREALLKVREMFVWGDGWDSWWLS